MLEDYSHIILDVSRTLYDTDKKPLNGSKEFLDKYCEKVIIFSNIGSITGNELRDELELIFGVRISQVVTSFDLLVNHLDKNKYKTIYHYGSKRTEEKIKTLSGVNIAEDDTEDTEIDAIIFTSLCDSSNWIKKTQKSLNVIANGSAKIILANPDRLSPQPPFSFTVSFIHDGIIGLCKDIGINRSSIELGKPSIKISDLGIEVDSKVAVVGDNPRTDGILASNNNLDFFQIGLSGNQNLGNSLIHKVNDLSDLI